MRLVPDKVFADITKITAETLEKENIKGLILDLDDTLATRQATMPEQEVIDWLKKTKDAGIKIYILSNNRKERVTRISTALGLPFHYNGYKPFPKWILNAVRELDVPMENVVAVGDQIFTDVCGAHLAKIKAWLVVPISKHETFLFRARRVFEKPFINKYYRENGVNQD